jgi:catechol 2,3-dioxygenase-like lactoylglutathione lyase family enzyme
MVDAFDRIVLGVPDLDRAVEQYRVLLGAAAFRCEHRSGIAWLGLPNTVVELRETGSEPAAIRSLVMSDPGGGAEAEPVANPMGLDLWLCDGSCTAQFRGRHPDAQVSALRVDHLVLRTASARDCIGLFSEQLGIRLALDRTVPEWGGRMLFFRTGKLTLEVIEPDAAPEGGDHFWGIAYQCRDIDSKVTAISEAGVTVSEVRPGRKPGTRVATVKSHCLGIPTLLIGAT